MMENFQLPKHPSFDEAKEYARKYLIKKGFFNASIGKKVWPTEKGIRKCISGKSSYSNIRVQLIFIIDHLIATAILYKIEKDNKQRKEITNIYKLKTRVRVNNKGYNVYITLHETQQGVLYYYHEGILIKEKKTP